MNLTLRVWRQAGPDAPGRFETYQATDIAEDASFLEMLDIVNERLIAKGEEPIAFEHDCREGICGSCGMMINGIAHGPLGGTATCQLHMRHFKDGDEVIVEPWRARAFPVIKDLVVDMDPFWAKMRAMQPWLQAGYNEPDEDREFLVSQQQMNVIHKEALCINCGCCVSECNSMESDPEFLGPAALAKGMRFIGDARDAATVERLEAYNSEHGIWDCTRCYFCQERCPKGVDPRDAIAKLGAESIKLGIVSR